MKISPKFLVLAAASLLGAQLAVCDSLYSFNGANQTYSDDPLTLGFAFTANSSFEVDSLGWFDATGGGFFSQHTVGIFDSTGNLLTSTTLSTGTSDPLIEGFRYGSITPITLAAGTEYILAGTSGGRSDNWTVNDSVNGFTVNPAFTIGQNAALFSPGASLVDPSTHFSDYLVYAGPNFQGRVAIADTATPEPKSFLLVTLAALVLFLTQKFRKPGPAK